MTTEQIEAFLVEIHHLIESSATKTASTLIGGPISNLVYPPNGGLNQEEIEAVVTIKGSPALESALRKILANVTAEVVFHSLNLVDGTGSPEGFQGEWPGFKIVESTDDDGYVPFLHEEFLDAYWKWRSVRPDVGWRLDNLGEAP